MALASNPIAGQAAKAGNDAAGRLTRRHACLPDADPVAEAIRVICAYVRFCADAIVTSLGACAVSTFEAWVYASSVDATTAIVTVLVRNAICGFKASATIQFTNLESWTVVVHLAAWITLTFNANIASTLIVAHAWAGISTCLRNEVACLTILAVGVVKARIPTHAVFAQAST